MDSGALTELDIINQMLATTGTAPLTAGSTQHPLYTKAKNKLRIVSRQVQSMRWWYNTSILTLTPNAEGHIVVPQGTTRADPVDSCSFVIRRGQKLVDTANNTFVFDGPILTEIVQMFDYEDLPAPVSAYIMARARQEYYADEDGADARKLADYKAQTLQAWQSLQTTHLAARDVNYFNNPEHTGVKLRRGHNRGTPRGRMRALLGY